MRNFSDLESTEYCERKVLCLCCCEYYDLIFEVRFLQHVRIEGLTL
jgi:hypothetical protein